MTPETPDNVATPLDTDEPADGVYVFGPLSVLTLDELRAWTDGGVLPPADKRAHPWWLHVETD